MDALFESIMTSFDEFHSKQSKVKGVAGMKQNILNGYRAGGPPPYGYKLQEVEVAKHRFGEAVTKTKLVPDPETAQIVQEYFERRARYEPRKSILEDFHRRGIPSPSGDERWSISTAKSWEDNVDVYLGHLVFNRLNERMKAKGRCEGFVGGKKWKAEEEWVIKENAHEQLITEETAGIIRAIKERGLREEPGQTTRTYALSGIMKCAECGTNYTGDRGPLSMQLAIQDWWPLWEQRYIATQSRAGRVIVHRPVRFEIQRCQKGTRSGQEKVCYRGTGNQGSLRSDSTRSNGKSGGWSSCTVGKSSMRKPSKRK